MDDYKDYFKCDECGGSGEHICPVCEGTGTVVEGTEDEDCPACGGTGEQTCPVCEGLGKVKID